MKKKDFIIIGSLFIVSVITLITVFFLLSKSGDIAYIYHKSDWYVKIDFAEQNYEMRPQTDGYPQKILPEDNPFDEVKEAGHLMFALLGDFVVDGQRTEIFIEVDMSNGRLRIYQDQTPQQIGVNRSWYNGSGLPVISAPNNVYIIFERTNDDDVDGVV